MCRTVRHELQRGCLFIDRLIREHNGIGTDRILVEEIEEVSPRRGCRFAASGQPTIFRKNRLAVGPNDLLDHLAPVERVRNTGKQKTFRRSYVKVVIMITIDLGLEHQCRAGGLIGDVGIDIIRLVNFEVTPVVCQEIAYGITTQHIHPYVANEKMGVDPFQQRSQLAAQFICMGIGGREFRKSPRKRRLHLPTPRGSFSRVDIPEVDQQCRRGGIIIDIATDDFEVDEKPLLVLYNTGLSGLDLDISCDTHAVILDANTQGKGFRFLYRLCECIVGVDVLG